jgi:hypothetical protein
MKHSESLIHFAPAFTKAQSELHDADKSESGYQNRYKYADLVQILEIIRPVFKANGIAILQLGDGSEPVIEVDEIHGKDDELVRVVRPTISIETILMHSSGEWISGSMVMPVEPMKGNSFAQAFGSVVSYMRRYSILAAVGITQTDDDAQQKTDSHPEGAANGHGKASTTKPASEKQVGTLIKIGKDESTPEETKVILREAIEKSKKPSDDPNRLTSSEASALIDKYKTW